MRPWEQNIRVVEPYVAGEQPKTDNMIKLNTNENPYPPAPGVRSVLNEFPAEDLRLYPDTGAGVLREALGEYYKVDSRQIFTGVGSDDVLAMSFLTFFNSDRPVLFPDITYSFYDVWAGLFRIPYERPAVDGEFRIRREDYYKENGGVVIANPNAPTSIAENLDFIRDILEHNKDVVVIVDEAYVDFGAASAVELVAEYDNLLVVQTFSKSRSMAGTRIGFAVGSRPLVKALENVRNSYNSYTMNPLSVAVGVEAVKDVDYFSQNVEKIINTRERFQFKMKELGFVFPDSKTNFIFASHRTVPAEVIFQELRKKNIFVRYFKRERIDNYLRITIGTEEEMNRFLTITEEILRNYTGNR